MVFEYLLEALGPVDFGGRADRAQQLDDVDRVIRLHVVDEPSRGASPFLQEVRAHEAGPERLVLYVDGAVRQEDRDPGGFRLPEHGLPPRLDDRGECNDVHPARDE